MNVAAVAAEQGDVANKLDNKLVPNSRHPTQAE